MLDDEDLEAIKFARLVIDAGFSEDVYVDISRVVGRDAAPTAETLLQVSIERFLDSSPREADFAMRLQEIADQLEPLLPLLLSFPVRMHVRAAIRNLALERRGEDVIALTGTRRMAVGFVDLVGFTALSETLSVTEASGVATTLERLASCVAEHEDGFPPLKIGAANGEVAARAGDVYGPAVNLASRLSDAAPPGQLLSTAQRLRSRASEATGRWRSSRRPAAGTHSGR